MGWVTVFWVSAIIIGYTYALYPLLIWTLARVKPNRLTQTADSESSVTVVIAARNEAANIIKRIENCLAQNYPEDLLDVVVVSNGSTDQTAEFVHGFSKRVRLIEIPPGGGKASALAAGVASSESDIIVFADARQTFDPNAIDALVKPFADPKVGGVTGELMLEGDSGGVGLYWRYEKLIRHAESRIDSTVGATGAIYAVRRGLWIAPPPNTLLDDVWVPMHVVKQGYRVVMTADAIAYDRVDADSGHEFERKVRTLAGNFQLMRLAPWINVPVVNRVWGQWVSHKLLRLLVPYFLLLCFLSSLMADGWLYQLAAAAQLAFYAIALLGFVFTQHRLAKKIASFPMTFVSLNSAAVMGLVAYLGKGTDSLWKTKGAR